MSSTPLKTAAQIAEADPATAPDPKPRVRKSQLLREKLFSLPLEVITLHTNTMALRGMVDRFAKDAVFLAGSTGPTGGIGHVPNATGDILRLIRDSETFHDTAFAGVMLRILEDSHEYKQADTVIAPMLAAIAEAEAQETAQVQEAYRRRSAFLDAQEAAKAKSLAVAFEDPAVMAARRAFEEAAALLPDPSVVAIREPLSA